MWLINCRTLSLEEFTNHREVRYAILSHTWEKGEEVQFSEFRNREATGKSGWRKIEKTCQLALNDGCEFAWVDTCCIDKTSSADLAEAINSMFPWYAGSEICYTYLADYDASDTNARLSGSRWFTRGWALQELIAPGNVHFYDQSWGLIGTKDVLGQQISLITGIEHEVLLASKDRRLEDVLDQLPVARKMSWAAKRETTRIEDTAYCLLGIFGVNLPLLYGEGDRAFIRLQEEVLKTKNDLSLLAWKSLEDRISPDSYRYCGVLAPHPRNFQASGDISLIDDIKFTADFTMTNKGLKIHTRLHYNSRDGLQHLDLNCCHSAQPQRRLSIYLKHQGASVYARAIPHLFASLDDRPPRFTDTPFPRNHFENKPFFLSKSISPSIAKSLHRLHRLSFKVVDHTIAHSIPKMVCSPSPLAVCTPLGAKPEALWDSGRRMFITHGLRDFVGVQEYSFKERMDCVRIFKRFQGARFFVVFGFGYGFAPWARIVTSDSHAGRIVEREDWVQIAEEVNTSSSSDIFEESGERLCFGKSYTSDAKQHEHCVRAYLNVKLEEITSRSEKQYVVRLDCEQDLDDAVSSASD